MSSICLASLCRFKYITRQNRYFNYAYRYMFYKLLCLFEYDIDFFKGHLIRIGISNMLNLRVTSFNSSVLMNMLIKPDGSVYATHGCELFLLQILSEKLPFSYTLIPAHEHGRIDSSGRWTGMMGMLERNEADVAIGWMSITHERQKVVDYCFPYLIDKNEVVTSAPKLLHNEVAFLCPFHYLVWVFIIVSIFFSTLFVSSLKRFNYNKGIDLRKIPSIFVSEIGNITAFLLNQGSFRGCVRDATRLFLCMWSFASFVLCLSYSCTLLSVLVAPLKEAPLKTVHELRNAVINGQFKFGVLEGTLYYNNLMAHKTGDMKDLADYVRANPDCVLDGYEEGMHRMTIEKFAIQSFHMDTVIIGSKFDLNNFHIIPDTTGFSLVGMAFRKQLPLIETMNQLVHRITQSGIYYKQLNEMMFWAKLRGKHQSPAKVIRPLSFEDIDSQLIVLNLGLALSICCLFAELLCKKYWKI